MTDIMDDTMTDEDAQALAALMQDELQEELAYTPDSVNINALKLLLSRLAQILAQEADMLDDLHIDGLADVQKEKKALVDALEKQKKLIIRRGDLLDTIDEDEAEELREIVNVFETIASENHKRLLIAKEVNARVVEAIADIAHKNAEQSFYTHLGERAGDPSVSLSLNRSI